MRRSRTLPLASKSLTFHPSDDLRGLFSPPKFRAGSFCSTPTLVRVNGVFFFCRQRVSGSTFPPKASFLLFRFFSSTSSPESGACYHAATKPLSSFFVHGYIFPSPPSCRYFLTQFPFDFPVSSLFSTLPFLLKLFIGLDFLVEGSFFLLYFWHNLPPPVITKHSMDPFSAYWQRFQFKYFPSYPLSPQGLCMASLLSHVLT